MTINEVIAKIKDRLDYRTPEHNKPLGHIVLTREMAQVLVAAKWLKPMDKSEAPQTIDEAHKLLD